MSLDLIGAVVLLEEKANMAKSFGVGAIAFGILVGLMVALVAFGGGREHS